MGFFNSLKEKVTKRDTHAAPSRSAPSRAQPVVMEWDKIYVEIDNDANGTVANDPTQRRSGRSMALSESQSFYQSKDSTFDTRSYGNMGIMNSKTEDSGNTPCVNNSKTFNSGVITGDPSSEDDEAPTVTTAGPSMTAAQLTLPMSDDNTQATGEFSITKGGKYLANNHFANAQLMRWKHAAEEGPCFVQVMLFLAALGAMFTTLFPLITIDNYWSVPVGICAFHTTMLCLLILAFEIRVCGARNPMSLRAKLRNFLVKHLNILRLVWGRGLLCIFAGSMNITIFFYPFNFITGGILIALGILSILLGAHAAYHLERLRLSLTDHSYLWNKFVKADSDNDNLIGIDDFSNLIWSLGLELDDAYTYRAFKEIDHDGDKLINFYEFKSWWVASQDDDGTIITMDYSKTSFISGNKKIPNSIRTGKFSV